MKKILFIATFLMFAFTGANAQKKSKTESVTFQTSAKCGMCKMRLEKDMSLAKGVQTATLDLTDKKMTLVYNPRKTNKTKLQNAIAKIGYDADEVVANQKSHDALPGCCRKTASAHEEM
jgi:periplasmic mercuric ion binding protein